MLLWSSNSSLYPVLLTTLSSAFSMQFLKLASFVAAAAVLAGNAFGWQAIAHRGVFHDVDDRVALSENTLLSVVRAYDLGMPGAEIDLRLASDGTVMVFHDQLVNRGTVDDNDGGQLDSVDMGIIGGAQPAGININSRTGAQWSGTQLKTYGRNGKLISNELSSNNKMLTLDQFLSQYKDAFSDNERPFMLILDVQNPGVFERAAWSVRNAGLQNSVYLKFFATSAIDSSRYRYNGPETCAAYAHYNGLTGLKIIPQFNSGDIADNNGNPVINVFQTQLSIQDYLNCWAGAQTHYGGVAADMTHVAASVAANAPTQARGSQYAVQWANANGRSTISILPNPDAGRIIGTTCEQFTFQFNNVAAKSFDTQGRDAKEVFIDRVGVDYVVVDVMGVTDQSRYITAYQEYSIYLC